MNKSFYMKNIIIVLCMIVIIVFNYSMPIFAEESEEEQAYYESVEFISADEAEREEIIHLLLAKLTYDYLDGYEGRTVAEYIDEHPEEYDMEIWEDSGITYRALYNSIIGDWNIYKVFNHNAVTGFYGVVFINEDRVIYSLRGSDMFTEEFPLNESNDWIATDFKFAIMNELSRQFDDFDSSYKVLVSLLQKDGYGDYEITLTGHSLGGALVTYGSLTTDCFGYSFDGACGHVIDLIYMEDYLKIDGFTGANDISNVKFINYTDDTGFLVADLIQHTGTGNFYQIDRTSFVDGMLDNDFMSQVADADAHHIWSVLSYEDNKVFFNDKVDCEDSGYTYMPEDVVYIDINKNVVEATLEEFDIFAPWEFFFDFDTEYMIDSALGNVKNGRVVLAPISGGEFFADKHGGNDEEYDVDTVMYGGVGDDQFIGGAGDDVFVSGGGMFNTLYGKGGEDTYVIDAVSNQINFIMDLEGEKVKLIFRNPNRNIMKTMKLSDDGVISLPEGQEITIGDKSEFSDVELYICRGDRLLYIGTYEDLLLKDAE